MSYEGYVEYLCEQGHLTSYDAYEENPKICTYCSSKFVFRHSVDQTNGIDYEYPETYGYPFEEVDFKNIKHRDHYNNIYYTKLPIYKIPVDK